MGARTATLNAAGYEVVEIEREERSKLDPRRADALFHLARMLRNRGAHAEAIPLLEEIEESIAVDSADRPDRFAFAREALGLSLIAVGRMDDAEPLLIDTYERLEARFESDHEFVTAIAAVLVELYEAKGEPERADRYRREREEPAPDRGGDR